MATIQNILNAVFDPVAKKLKADVAVTVDSIDSITNDVTIKNSESSPTLAVDQKRSASLTCGYKTIAAHAGAAAIVGTSTPCHAVILQADPSNGVSALIGDATHQLFALTTTLLPVTIPISDASLIYVATANPLDAVTVNFVILA